MVDGESSSIEVCCAVHGGALMKIFAARGRVAFLRLCCQACEDSIAVQELGTAARVPARPFINPRN